MSESRTSRRAMLGLLGTIPFAGGLVTTGGTAALAEPRRIPPAMRPGGEFDRFIAHLADRDEFSGTVVVAHRGETVLARSHGMANKDRNIPNRRRTIYNLASATKPFTGLAIMQLTAAGRVKLHETVGTYLDGFPPKIAGTVTVDQLLTHSSGFGDFQLDPEYQANAETGWTSEAAMMDGIMAVIRRMPLEYPPGTRSSYSNAGMATLGAIVAAVSGQSYYDYVRRHILRPAGMTGTDYYHRPQWLSDPRFAHPYWFNDQGEAVDGLLHRPPQTPTGHAGLTPFVGNPGGGGFSTADDIVRFDRALRRGTLLDPDYLELFMSLKRPWSGNEGPVQISGIAYVLTATLHNHQWLVGHGGGMYAGVNTNWTIYRDSDWTGVVLSNYFGKSIAPITEKERQLITEHTA